MRNQKLVRTLRRTLGALSGAVIAVCGLTATAQAQDAAPLKMLYYERKPFHSTEGGKPAGIIVTATEAAFAKAGITLKWEKSTVNRVFALLKLDTEPVCSAGWYLSPERRALARFSLPIYRDRPLVGLSWAGLKTPPEMSATSLLARPDTRLLLKHNYIYGAYFDGLIAKMAPAQIRRVVVPVPDTIRMLTYDHSAITLVTQEEVALYVTQSGRDMSEFRLLKFPDVLAIETRHIICSKKVPAQTMEKLDLAIKEVVDLVGN
jgi:polar amino acid transport system substrate-binding protein